MHFTPHNGYTHKLQLYFVSLIFIIMKHVMKMQLCNLYPSFDSVENKGVNSTRLVACITTLYLFSKIRAQLMVKHAMTMQPYLTTKCNVSGFWFY